MYASPLKKPVGRQRQLAVKNISKEEYGQRMDVPKNDPGIRSNSVKKKMPNSTIDLAQFGLSDTKRTNQPSFREPRKTLVTRGSEDGRTRLESMKEENWNGDSWRDNSYRPSASLSRK